MIQALESLLKQKIQERDELIENGADRDDIVSINIRIGEIKSELERERLKEEEQKLKTELSIGESHLDINKTEKGEIVMAGKTAKKTTKKVAKKPAKKTTKKSKK